MMGNTAGLKFLTRENYIFGKINNFELPKFISAYRMRDKRIWSFEFAMMSLWAPTS